MKWFFQALLPGQVETDVTQRDQFSNDEVDLAETIVREAIQNSLDAAVDEPANIRVSFRWLNKSHGLLPEFMKNILDGQLPHAKKAGLIIEEIDFNNPTALIIEDFGTRGLTGALTTKDDDNFSDFWRRHGKSHKTGKHRGRWGLGKLVYSITSRVGVFFGATVRLGDTGIYIMGQTVLNLRTIDNKVYPPHAFFSDIQNQGDLYRELPVPLIDQGLVGHFITQFSLNRVGNPGLSVIIPFPNLEFNSDVMIPVAIINYFYPVITGQLILHFDNVEINSSNIRSLAHRYAKKNITDIDELFDFIEEIFIAEKKQHYAISPDWLKDGKLGENDFNPDDLEVIRKEFAEGKLVGITLPVSIKTKDKQIKNTSFSVYLKRPENLVKGVDLYVRGGLTLPGESKFRDRKSLGAMIAEDEAICSFLGDAENAAHTHWSTTAEKLRKNYIAPQPIVKSIKNSILDLYDLLAGISEEVDEEALSSFFWMQEPEDTGRGKRTKKPRVVIPPTLVPRVRDFSISQIMGGFTVSTTGQTTADRFPQTIQIDMAYDTASGNPFKKYSEYDFTVGANGGVEIALTKDKGRIVSRKENRLQIEVTGIPFRLNVSGFDVNRDLKVRLEKVN